MMMGNHSAEPFIFNNNKNFEIVGSGPQFFSLQLKHTHHNFKKPTTNIIKIY